MNNIMLDLETMGTKSSAPIIAIGAVAFDRQTKQLGEEFHIVVDLQSSVEAGTIIDPSTVLWWMDQSDEARKVFKQKGTRLSTALMHFTSFVNSVCPPVAVGKTSNVKLWGNGSDFDNVILGNAYDLLKMPRPWVFWNNSCYRTMKNEYSNVPLKRVGVAHNALDDAKTQALHLMEMV